MRGAALVDSLSKVAFVSHTKVQLVRVVVITIGIGKTSDSDSGRVAAEINCGR